MGNSRINEAGSANEIDNVNEARSMYENEGIHEIGSIYEISPDSIRELNDGSRQNLNFSGLREVKKYNKNYCAYTASCREAIALALRSLEKCKPNLSKTCLLPAYMCDTVFFPFEHEGWEIHFYHVNKNLEVDEKNLYAQIENIKPGLLFIHPYYGVDTCKSIRPLFAKIKEQGICIMEDVTQSYYLKGVGIDADYVVGSLRKWYPVPDGGFVVSDEKLALECMEANGEYAKTRLEILMDKWEYLHGKDLWDVEKRKLDKEAYLKRNREMEEQLDNYSGIRKISNETAYILERIDECGARLRRSENYKYLYDELKSRMLVCDAVKDKALKDGMKEAQTQIAPIISIPEDYDDNEIAPLYCAIYVNKRDELQSFLSKRGIYAPVLWPIGKENVNYLTNDEKYIYEHMLALPIDQRYGREEMQYIVKVMEEYGRQGEMSTELIGIRADANEEIATGHIMRCITIAKQLIKLGKRVCFFTADEYVSELLEQAKMEHECLNSEWNDMIKELPRLREELERRGCDKLLVDSYRVNAEYFESLSDICKLIYIDDCFEEIYPVDMLINYNAYHVRFNYEEAYKKAYQNKTQLLLGTDYVPLREEFQGRICTKGPTQLKIGRSYMNKDMPEDKHVLVSSGGGDIYNALTGILNEAIKDKELDNVIFHTVVGRFNPNAEELKLLAEKYTNIKLHHDVKNMAELMANCNAAISAAGTMLFELSAMQVPSVFFVSADNQQYDSEFFAKAQRMLFAGDIRTDKNECIKNICGCLKKILNDDSLCQRMKKALSEVTDGRGAERIAEAIVEI